MTVASGPSRYTTRLGQMPSAVRRAEACPRARGPLSRVAADLGARIKATSMVRSDGAAPIDTDS